MTVITISRQFGSGGDAIAERICSVMNYRQFDKLMLIKAAAESGLSEQEIIDFSEDNYKVQHFFDRLFRRQENAAKMSYWVEDPEGVRIVEEMNLSEHHLLMLVQKAVLSAYQSGNVVIVGRGGQMILRDFADVLHLRIEAPMEDRLQNVRATFKKSEGAVNRSIDHRRMAQDLINEHDLASEEYLKRFYDVRWDDPMLYHLVMNTGKMNIEQASDCIVSMLRNNFEAKPVALTGSLS
jgi:cytidylate kinase